MPSAKARGAKPRSSLKRDDARSKRKGKEVRELWFNPHAKKRGETLEEIYGCDCDCDVMLDENVQRELRRLSKVYSQTAVDEGDEDDKEGKSKGFLCFKKSSQRSRSKQKEDEEKTKRRKSKEKEDREKTKRRKSKEKEDMERSKRRKSNERESARREHERKSHSRPQSSANGKFKTQEEVRHYRELKRIYTTKPRPRQSRAKPAGTTCFKKKDKRREEGAENSLESSSNDSVYSATHETRKPKAESATKSRARSNKRDASSRQRRSSQREDDKKQKEKKKDKKSDVGCCGKRKKSKADEEEEEFEAYKLAQSAPKVSKKPTVPPECALTPEEIELLEKLKQTYAMEEPKVVRKAPQPPPPEEPGCCGTKSKKKKRRPEDESYSPRKTKSAETNVKLKKPLKTGKSKSDSSFYTSGRKETPTMKHKNCFCFGCIRRKCQSGKPTKKDAKKPKEKTKIQHVKRPKKPEKPNKSDDRKPKPSKAKSQEELHKPDYKLSCCSFQKNKTKEDDSQQKLLKQSPDVKKDSEQVGKKLSFLSCCSLSRKDKQKKEATPKAKLKKPDEVQQKPPKPKDYEKLPKKTSNVSCCSFTKSDRSKKQADNQQKPTKVRDKEKPQKKESNVSCCSITKKEKSKKLDETAQNTKDKPKKSVGTQQKAPKKEGRNLFNMWCCSTDKKEKTKKEHDMKNVKSQEKMSTKPSNMTCCSFSKKPKPKKLSESTEKPPSTKQKIKVKEKLTAASCCTVFKKDNQTKSNDTAQRAPKKKASEISCSSICKKDKQSKTKYSQQMSPRTKVKVQIKKKSVKPKSRERTQNPFDTFCAFCKKRRNGKPKLMKPPTPIKSTSPPRQDSIKPQSSKPKRKTKSEMSFKTCWDWFDDDGDDKVPIRKETMKRDTNAEKLEQTAPKSKSSCTSFWTCCSSMCVPKKTKRERKSERTDKSEIRKQTIDEGAVKTKPENISYCKALYQEFENLARQQKLCPILLPENSLDKKAKRTINKYGFSYCQQNPSQPSIKETRLSSRTKSRKQQQYQKQNRKSKAKEDKEIRKKLEQQKEPSVTYIKLPKRRVKSDIQNENSNSDSGIENAYAPQYVLGKPVQLGVPLAHARNMTYNLIFNSDAHRPSDKYFNKGFTYGIGCQN